MAEIGQNESGFTLGYRKAPEVGAFAQSLIEHFEEDFGHLDGMHIGFLFAEEVIELHGNIVLGFAAIPQGQGLARGVIDWALGGVFGFLPDAVVVMNAEAWQEMTGETRAALTYHELSHIRQKVSKKGRPSYDAEGRPVLVIVNHDVEEFFEVARRFGEWEPGMTKMREISLSKEGKIDRKTMDSIIARAAELAPDNSAILAKPKRRRRGKDAGTQS